MVAHRVRREHEAGAGGIRVPPGVMFGVYVLPESAAIYLHAIGNFVGECAFQVRLIF